MNKILIPCSLAILLLINLKLVAQQTPQNHQRERGEIVYDLPNTDKVIIKGDITYYKNENSTLNMDIYYPPGFDFKSKIPTIIIVLGYPDNAGMRLLGSKFKNYIQFTSWCRIIATSGIIAIAYESINPEQDIIHLSKYLKQNADLLNIDISV